MLRNEHRKLGQAVNIYSESCDGKGLPDFSIKVLDSFVVVSTKPSVFSVRTEGELCHYLAV